MQRVADLHVHTYLSDGSFSPQKVVEYSKAKGLDAIAITDHDCCDGITPAIIAAKDLDLEVIPGVELSAEMEDDDIHILGYLIDWQDMLFLDRLRKMMDVRKDRAKEILRRLRKLKVMISDEELFEFAKSGCVGRLHIAQLLVRGQYVASIAEAFRKYIGNNGPCYVKKFKLSPKEAVDMIKGVGGIAVLAHPKTINTKDRSIEEIMKTFVADGVQGLEVYHSDHTSNDENRFKALAEKYGLVITGGSDCHGLGKKEALIGKIKIPYGLVEKLKKRIEERCSEDI
jgi:predicted metal-dependent phosphoesterase TrpH